MSCAALDLWHILSNATYHLPPASPSSFPGKKNKMI